MADYEARNPAKGEIARGSRLTTGSAMRDSAGDEFTLNFWVLFCFVLLKILLAKIFGVVFYFFLFINEWVLI